MTANAPPPIVDWRRIPADELESHFNPRMAVADAQALLDARAAESEATRTRIGGDYDRRYGPGPKQTFDLHRPPGATGPTPAVVFIHGGFWRALDKSDHTFLAPAFLDRGTAVVNMNYDLCPAVTLSQLTAQVLDGIAHVARSATDLGIDPARICLMGHSAGAHAVAMALAADWTGRGFDTPPIRAAICKSGIYEAEVARRIAVNEQVRLTPALAAENDALQRPPRPGASILITVGGDEPPGWIGQSLAYHALARDGGADCRLEVVPGANHFTVLSGVTDPARPEHRLVMDFIRERV